MRGEDQELRFPIGTVARRTGLSPHLLRAWERRYAVVEPGRSEGGLRLYSDADVARLRLLRRLTEDGYPIGRLAGLSTAELRDRVRAADEPEPGNEASAVVASPEAGDRFLLPILDAVEEMDGARTHALLSRAAVALGSVDFVESVVVPLLREVGELWARGQICPAHEHMASVSVQRVLAWLLDALPTPPGAPVMVSTTPPGQRHELGAMLAGVMAAESGWRVVYFGPDLPEAEIVRAAEVTRARAVALSVLFETDEATLASQLEAVRAGLDPGVALVVGGRGAEPHQEVLRRVGVSWAPDLRSLAGLLQVA